MKFEKQKLKTCCVTGLGVFLSLAVSASALAFAQYFPIQGSRHANPGDIVSFKDRVYYLSNSSYDPNMFAVVVDNPTVIYGDKTENSSAAVTSGLVKVNVTTANGDIEAGDYITSSLRAGVGVKATKSGPVLGKSQEDFKSDNQSDIGQVAVALNIHEASIADRDRTPFKNTTAQIKAALSSGLKEALNEPDILSRYLVAAVVFLLSMGASVWIFGRAVISGIVAIGRNPAARGTILTAVVFNIVMIMILISAGVFVSVLLAGA